MGDALGLALAAHCEPMKHLAYLTFLTATGVAAQPCDSVDTRYEKTYQNHGAMFNVVAYSPIVIDHITANISWNTALFELYYKVGGFQGHETTPGAWTLLGSANVNSNNTQFTDTIPTVIPIAINQAMIAGDTLAFYLSATPLSKVFLKATTIPWGTYYYTDANLGVSIARSMYQLFGVPFSTPQIWNGSVAYCEDNSTGLGEMEQESTLFYGQGQVHLALAGAGLSNDGQARLTILDMTGRMVAEERITTSQGTIPLHGLPAGWYIARVWSPKGEVLSKRIFID